MFSIIIPYYQKETGILIRCLRHISKQSAYNDIDEIIVVDDGSPVSADNELTNENNITELNNIKDKIKIYKKSNGGASSARNYALERTSEKTRYIAFCDSDDMWLPHHLENAKAIILYRSGFYFSNFYQLESEIPAFERGKRLKLKNHTKLENNNYQYKGSMIEQILNGNIIGTSCVVYNFKNHKSVRFNENLKLAGEDYSFWLSIAIKEKNIVFNCHPSVKCGHGVNIFSGAKWGSSNLVKRNIDFLNYTTTLPNLLQPKTEKLLNIIITMIIENRKQLIKSLLPALKRGKIHLILPTLISVKKSGSTVSELNENISNPKNK